MTFVCNAIMRLSRFYLLNIDLVSMVTFYAEARVPKWCTYHVPTEILILPNRLETYLLVSVNDVHVYPQIVLGDVIMINNR
jgi:hypothetical protein